MKLYIIRVTKLQWVPSEYFFYNFILKQQNRQKNLFNHKFCIGNIAANIETLAGCVYNYLHVPLCLIVFYFHNINFFYFCSVKKDNFNLNIYILSVSFTFNTKLTLCWRV